MKIIILAGQDNSADYIFNVLSKKFLINVIIKERPISKYKFIKRRIKRLGLKKVIGQILFMVLYLPGLRFISNKRIKSIISNYGLEAKSFLEKKIITVPSVNSFECINLLKQIRPDIILVSGTRIISKKVLKEINAVFINYHAGITPKYRGVHGAYWALVNNDIENCGVTVHLIDSGIDTGSILYQKTIRITSKDNFATYPFLQLVSGIGLLEKALHDIINKNPLIIKKRSEDESKLWFHPTLCQYIYYCLFKGIK